MPANIGIKNNPYKTDKQTTLPPTPKFKLLHCTMHARNNTNNEMATTTCKNANRTTHQTKESMFPGPRYERIAKN